MGMLDTQFLLKCSLIGLAACGSHIDLGTPVNIDSQRGGKGGSSGYGGAGGSAMDGSAGAGGSVGSGGSAASAGSGGVPMPTACWESQLPAEIQPIPPPKNVTEECDDGDNNRTSLSWVASPDAGDQPERPDILVGRWRSCGGSGVLSSTVHDGIEFGANGRWRLLRQDPILGLVALDTPTGDSQGRYHLLGTGLLVLLGEGFENGHGFTVRLTSDLGAAYFSGDIDFGWPIYARTTASPLNGRDNPPSIADRACTLVGTWDTQTIEYPDAALPPDSRVTLSFDEAGNFVGGPLGTDLCQTHEFYGTYRLSPDLFQFTNYTGGSCDGAELGMPIVFDDDCLHATVTTRFDNCTGRRGYFNRPTILSKR